MTLTDRKIVRCEKCHFGKWSGQVCSFCNGDAVLNYSTKIVRRVAESVDVKKKETPEVLAPKSVCIEKVTRPHHRSSMSSSEKPCYACGRLTPNSTRTCSTLCTTMMRYAIYSPKGIKFKETREKVLEKLVNRKNKKHV